MSATGWYAGTFKFYTDHILETLQVNRPHWGVLKLIHTDATLVCLSFFVTLYSPCSAHGTLQANIQHSFSNVLLRSPATIGSGLAVCGKVSLAQKIASSTLKTNSYNQRQDRYY